MTKQAEILKGTFKVTVRIVWLKEAGNGWVDRTEDREVEIVTGGLPESRIKIAAEDVIEDQLFNDGPGMALVQSIIAQNPVIKVD